MANLVQTDWDALAPQIVNRKRTSGGNAGKVITEWSIERRVDAGAAAPSTANPVCVVTLFYPTGTAPEKFIFGGDVDCYPPGQRATVAG